MRKSIVLLVSIFIILCISSGSSIAAVAGHNISNTQVITFAVTSNNPASIVPKPCANCTITETISAALLTDLSQNSNVMKDVLLSDSLPLAKAMLVSSSPMPDCKADEYACKEGGLCVIDDGGLRSSGVVALSSGVGDTPGSCRSYYYHHQRWWLVAVAPRSCGPAGAI